MCMPEINSQNREPGSGPIGRPKVPGDIADQPWLEALPEECVRHRGFNGEHIVAVSACHFQREWSRQVEVLDFH